MATAVEVKNERAPFRLQEWFEPSKFARLFSHLQPFDEPIKVEEEVVGTDLVIRAELPGFDPDKDIEITVDDGMMTLKAERRREEKSEEDGTFRTEFSYGAFRRTLTLPRGATAKDVTASYADGILQVKVPMPSTDGPAEKVAITRS